MKPFKPKYMKNFLSLGTKDFIKGFFVAIGASVLTGVQTSLESGAMPDAHSGKVMAMAGLGAGITYLLKNLFTNSKGALMKSEPTDVMPLK